MARKSPPKVYEDELPKPKLRQSEEYRHGPKPKALDNVDLAMLGHIDKNPNITYKDLGQLVGMTKAGVSKRYKRPVFQAALVDLNRSTWDIILKAKKVAARRLLALANSKDPWVAIRAAQLLFGPTLQDPDNKTNATEIIFKAQIGEGGAIISSVEELNEAPKNTLELLNGKG